jgi:DNA-binding transcriptional ArsR family regulator
VVEHSVTVLDATYAALSNQTRRSLLLTLRDGPARVTELAAPYDLSLEAVSKHIRMLERAGLVRREIRGRNHWVGLTARPLRDASAWIERYREFWEGRLDALEAFLRESGDG